MFLVFTALLMPSCSDDDPVIIKPVKDQVTSPEDISIQGLYILNEGNMGSNKASLDYFDYTTGIFTKNIYGNANPNIVNNLGDVGNDIQIYGSKMYAVINASNYVEVMEAKTAKHIGEIKIPNCRYIVFDKGYAYVSSYAGPIGIDPNAQLGYVAKIDTATLQIVAKEIVGYQPDEMVIVHNKLYIANSGGYRFPNYDTTVSVIDLNTFKETKKIEVAINLWRIRKDKNSKIWVTSRGNYSQIPPKTFLLNPITDAVEKEIDIVVSDMSFIGNKMYYYGYAWTAQGVTTNYGIIDVDTQKVISNQFIKNGVQTQIEIPYAIIVNPVNGDIFVADAKDYVSPGKLFCFDSIDTKTLTPLFYEIPEQKNENGVALQYKQIFYGAGLRIDPVTDNLIITTTQSGYGAHYQKNWVHKVDNKGELIQTYPLDDYYWFPTLPVFPDNYAPQISQTLPSELFINSETIIDLKDKVTDADNLNSAIVKTLKEIDNNGIITALINKEDQLVLTPLKKGTASIEIKFNSNGKIVSRELAVKVASTLGTDDISAIHSLALYPNPCKEYFFIEVQRTDLLSIYSLLGNKVYEQKLEKGKNKIQVSLLKSGIYFVKTQNNTYKIIIQ